MSGRGSADSASDATREDLKLKPMVGYIRMNANVIELYSKSENLGYWDDNFKYDLGGDLFTRLTEVYKDGVLFPVLEDSRVLHTWPQPRYDIYSVVHLRVTSDQLIFKNRDDDILTLNFDSDAVLEAKVFDWVRNKLTRPDGLVVRFEEGGYFICATDPGWETLNPNRLLRNAEAATTEGGLDAAETDADAEGADADDGVDSGVDSEAHRVELRKAGLTDQPSAASACNSVAVQPTKPTRRQKERKRYQRKLEERDAERAAEQAEKQKAEQ